MRCRRMLQNIISKCCTNKKVQKHHQFHLLKYKVTIKLSHTCKSIRPLKDNFYLHSYRHLFLLKQRYFLSHESLSRVFMDSKGFQILYKSIKDYYHDSAFMIQILDLNSIQIIGCFCVQITFMELSLHCKCQPPFPRIFATEINM